MQRQNKITYIKCNVITFWRIYKDDSATGHMHKGMWYNNLVVGKTAMMVLDNMDKGIQCDKLISGLVK
jgi:hypothetical protein